MNASMPQSSKVAESHSGMSYKFQRLRERVRRAIESGELTGKLPGERALAKRFHVNAKTLSKALTDLAAEGLLDRSIGRGTYVRGSEPAQTTLGKWLVLCNPNEENGCTVGLLRAVCPELKSVSSVTDLRPSFLNQFTAVVNLSSATPDTFLRDLLVRNIPIVTALHEPKTYSVHAVLVDVSLGVSRLGRDLLLAGHRRIAAVESNGTASVSQALRQTAARYAPDAIVHVTDATGVEALLQTGVTALVCGSLPDARAVRSILKAQDIAVPRDISVAAVACGCPDADCSGYFVECQKIADAVISLLKEPPARPITFWLPGEWIDRGTFAPAGALVK